jgi:hypothetical protein
MSYAVVYMPLKTVQGETVLVADLPVAEVSRTASEVVGDKMVQLWPTLVSQAVDRVGTYVDEKLWPEIRAEVDRATKQAEARMTEAAKSASTQVTWIGLAAAVGIGAVGLYFYSWNKGRKAVAS